MKVYGMQIFTRDSKGLLIFNEDNWNKVILINMSIAFVIVMLVLLS